MNLFVEIKNSQKVLILNPRKIRRFIEDVLKDEIKNAASNVELSLSFVNDRKIRRLNQKYLQTNSATDVLAFQIDEDPPKEGHWLLGEVVVSVERAVMQSKIFGKSVGEEVARYIVHGILHLLGYRDDKSAASRKMWMRQEEILKKAFNGI